jgi:predicted outer membrane repeat protein
VDNCPLRSNPDQYDCDNDGVGDVCTIAYCPEEASCDDCNFNDIPDACDIDDGYSEDINLNGTPDECEVIDSGIIFVDQTAVNGANDGSSWADAFIHLQDALAYASDTVNGVVAIWVADGTYWPDQGAGVTPGDRTASFVMVDGVSVFGGFSGFLGLQEQPGEFNLDDRTELTTLSGDIDRDGSLANNSYQVLRAGGNINGIMWDGFWIKDGHAEATAQPYDRGAGIYNNGGAFAFFGEITNNHASNAGGGIYTTDGDVTIVQSTIRDNSAGIGGGIYTTAGDLTVVDTVLSNNGVETAYLPTYGGGVAAVNNPFLYLGNSTVLNNLASVDGGGVYLSGSSTDSIFIFDVVFRLNNAWNSGGAIYNNQTTPSIRDCRFLSNYAGGEVSGGGAYAGAGNPEIVQSIFSANSAADFGGAIFTLDGSVLTLVNSTFSENDAGEGNAVFNEANAINDIANSIFWSSTTQSIVGGSVNIRYSIVQGGFAGGTNIIAGDPRYIDADGVDNLFGTLDDNLRLLVDSPAIDAGDNDALPDNLFEDIAGLPRRADSPLVNDTGNPGSLGAPIVDLGAHERQP